MSVRRSKKNRHERDYQTEWVILECNEFCAWKRLMSSFDDATQNFDSEEEKDDEINRKEKEIEIEKERNSKREK